MDDPNPWLVLARVPGLHAGKLPPGPLREDPTRLVRESRNALAALGLTAAAIDALRDPEPVGLADDERWLAGGGRRLAGYGTPEYPLLLAAIEDAPLVLFVMVALGLVLGVAGSLAVTGVLKTLLVDVSRLDPVTIGGVVVVLAIVAAGAAYLPARRASAVDPMVALRRD